MVVTAVMPAHEHAEVNSSSSAGQAGIDEDVVAGAAVEKGAVSLVEEAVDEGDVIDVELPSVGPSDVELSSVELPKDELADDNIGARCGIVVEPTDDAVEFDPKSNIRVTTMAPTRLATRRGTRDADVGSTARLPREASKDGAVTIVVVV